MADDFSSNIFTTGTVAVNGAATGNLEIAGDHDWFATFLIAGHSYLIHERGSPSGGGTLSDPFLTLHNNVGTPLTTNDDGGLGFDSELAVTVSTSGVYFVDAGGFSDANTGTYTVDVQDLGTNATRFQAPAFGLAQFGNVDGWSSFDTFPRELANLNFDDARDIVGFGAAGVYVSLATGGGHFAPITLELAQFGAAASAGGWSSQDTYPREVADVSGDGRTDIVGFGAAGVYVSLGTGVGHFAPITFELAQFGAAASGGGWSSQDAFPRELADVNGDGRADIVGFGFNGVYVSLATGGGHFAAPTFELAQFGAAASGGGWSSDNLFHRELADVNSDGRADIVGFGAAGVFVSLATGGGHFAPITFELAQFGAAASGGGWSSDNLFHRELADVNFDGRTDIVGFGAAGVFVSLGTGGGHFAPITADLAQFGVIPSAGGWASENQFPRALADVTGDGRADVVGFGILGAFVSPSHDFQLI